ncbi:MAG: DUF881 domain-containing protein [Bacillota bacterium]|nr:DUF881 domain-containing protein [Bacillota bacterium]
MKRHPVPLWLQAVLLLAVSLNSLLVAQWLHLVRLPGSKDDLTLAKEGGLALVSYYQKLAEARGVAGEEKVQASLKRLEREIKAARAPAQVAEAIGRYDQILGLIDAAYLQRQEGKAVALVNLELERSKVRVSGPLVLHPDPMTGRIAVEDEQALLPPPVKARLEEEASDLGLQRALRLEVVEGRARIATPADQKQKLALLRAELEHLRASLNEIRAAAGFAPLSGPGVIVRAYDAPHGHSWEQIVHDQNVRDLVNQLLGAGAQGVEVGGQRIVATSSIRCLGPVVVVNQKPVEPNPIVIKAVGSPQRLARSLDFMRRVFAATGKRLEVELSSQVVLAGYH